MLVDWFIVVAQIVNFLILVALLRWFLYQPVLSVMERRKEGIKRQWQEARQLQQKAEDELEEHRRLRQRLEAEKEDRRRQALADVERERLGSIEQMRQDLQEQRRRWHADLERQQEAALERLRAQLLEQVQSVARRALTDLASVQLEERIVDCFLDRLDQLGADRRDALLSELERQRGSVRLCTGFGLNEERREDLRRRLASRLPPLAGQALAFEREPRLLCGIELRTPTQAIGWNLEEYLTALDRSLAAALSSASGEDLVQAGG
jgi:F-type H+-transporting ATPase subunit b